MDKWLVDKLDSFTTALQKRGYLLTEIQVQVAGFTFVTCTFCAWIGGGTISTIINGLVFGINLVATIRWGNNNRDYPVSKKILDRLNAEAVRQREDMRTFRAIVLGIWCGFIMVDILAILVFGPRLKDFMSIISLTSLALMYHLYPCMYIGPGKFATKQQEREVVGDARQGVDS